MLKSILGISVGILCTLIGAGAWMLRGTKWKRSILGYRVEYSDNNFFDVVIDIPERFERLSKEDKIAFLQELKKHEEEQLSEYKKRLEQDNDTHEKSHKKRIEDIQKRLDNITDK